MDVMLRKAVLLMVLLAQQPVIGQAGGSLTDHSNQVVQTEDQGAVNVVPENGSDSPEQMRTEPAVLSGVTIRAVMKNDLLSVLAGGVERRNVLIASGDLILTADADALLSLYGGTMLVHFIANNGSGISAYSGDAQMVSNIEGYRTFKLYQCWYQQDVPSLGLSLLAGLFDLNSEFYVTPASSLFLNGSHGVGIELSQCGMNGPSIFPTTALAARVRYSLNEQLHLSTAVFDGHPGHPNDVSAFDIAVRADDGIFTISEVSYGWGAEDKVAVGAWYFSGSYGDQCRMVMSEQTVKRGDNVGIYLLADVRAYSEPEREEQGLSFFSRIGFANQHINPVQFHCGSGFSYTGLVDGRDEDIIGYAFAVASYGEDFRLLNAASGEEGGAAEIAHELTYRAVLNTWFTLQCDLQYIVHPSASLNIGSVFSAGFRFEAGL